MFLQGARLIDVSRIPRYGPKNFEGSIIIAESVDTVGVSQHNVHNLESVMNRRTNVLGCLWVLFIWGVRATTPTWRTRQPALT